MLFASPYDHLCIPTILNSSHLLSSALNLPFNISFYHPLREVPNAPILPLPVLPLYPLSHRTRSFISSVLSHLSTRPHSCPHSLTLYPPSFIHSSLLSSYFLPFSVYKGVLQARHLQCMRVRHSLASPS